MLVESVICIVMRIWREKNAGYNSTVYFWEDRDSRIYKKGQPVILVVPACSVFML